MLLAALVALAAIIDLMDHGAHGGLSGCNMAPVLNNPNKYQICFGDGTCSSFSCGPNRVLSLSECGCVRLQSTSINDVTSKTGTVASNANGLDKSTPLVPTGSFVTTTQATAVRTTAGTRMTNPPSFLPKGPVHHLQFEEEDEDREYSQDVRYCIVFKPHPSSSRKYVQETMAGNFTRDCPLGTIFSAMVCRCIIDPNPPPPQISSGSIGISCLPEVYIRAQNNLESSGSYGQISVDNSKVVLKNGKAEFDGSGYLKIDFYNGNEFTRGLTVAMTVEEAVEIVPRRQVLLSNCQSFVMPSLEIVLDPATSTVLFLVDVSTTSAVNVTVPYRPFVSKRLAMIYDGNTLTAHVDSETRTLDVKGVIEGRLQAVYIGNSLCGSNKGLHGYLDEIRIYRCVQRNVLDIS